MAPNYGVVTVTAQKTVEAEYFIKAICQTLIEGEEPGTIEFRAVHYYTEQRERPCVTIDINSAVLRPSADLEILTSCYTSLALVIAKGITLMARLKRAHEATVALTNATLRLSLDIVDFDFIGSILPHVVARLDELSITSPDILGSVLLTLYQARMVLIESTTNVECQDGIQLSVKLDQYLRGCSTIDKVRSCIMMSSIVLKQ